MPPPATPQAESSKRHPGRPPLIQNNAIPQIPTGEDENSLYYIIRSSNVSLHVRFHLLFSLLYNCLCYLFVLIDIFTDNRRRVD